MGGEIKTRGEQVAELLRAGATFEEVSEILDLPRPSVLREAMLLGVTLDAKESVVRRRWVQLERYEDMLRTIQLDVEAGARPDMNLALKIMAEERALMTLDLPKITETKITGSVAVGVTDLDRHSPEALARAERVLAMVLESGAEEVQDAEILALIESGSAREG